MLPTSLKTLEIGYPVFLLPYFENGIGVLVFIVEFPVFGIEFRLQVGVFVMDVGQKAGFGDFGFQAEKVGKDFEVSGKLVGPCMTC